MTVKMPANQLQVVLILEVFPIVIERYTLSVQLFPWQTDQVNPGENYDPLLSGENYDPLL